MNERSRSVNSSNDLSMSSIGNDIPVHSVWYHWSQLSHARASWPHMTAFEHMPHGYLIFRRPGLVSTQPIMSNVYQTWMKDQGQ
jgi:hypothetical protein